jgi:hypothetical protein
MAFVCTQQGPEIFQPDSPDSYSISPHPPPPIPDFKMITLFCLLKGKTFTNVFRVMLDKDDLIMDLMNQVKERSKASLEGVAAQDLAIYPVSIPLRDLHALEEASSQIDRGENTARDSTDVVGEVFPQPDSKTIQVIIKAPGKSPARTSVLSSFSTARFSLPPPMCLRMLTCSLCIQL